MGTGQTNARYYYYRTVNKLLKTLMEVTELTEYGARRASF